MKGSCHLTGWETVPRVTMRRQHQRKAKKETDLL